jgi:hypothetical protein
VIALFVSACGSGAPSGGGDTTESYVTGPPPGFTTGFCDTDICEGCNPVPQDPNDPQQVGEWSEVIDWSNDSMTGLPSKMACAGQMGCNPGPGFVRVPTHAVHLPTKKILFWGGILDQYLWDIDNETFEYVPADFSSYGCAFEQHTIVECTSEQDCYDYCAQYANGDCPDPLNITDPLLDCVWLTSAADLFCAGHTHHTDGEPFAIGGNVTGSFAGGGRTGIVAFDGIDTWMNTGDSTAYTLWYPSVTTLADGRVIVFGGDLMQNSTSLYNPLTGSVLTTVNHPTNPTASRVTYPFNFIAPDGRVFYAGAEAMSNESLWDGYYFDPSTFTWDGDPNDQDSTIPGGSAAMFALGQIMKSGGCTNANSRCEATAVAERIDLNDPGLPQWRRTCDMNHPRHFHTLTVLPDGTVLATGGNTRGNGSNDGRCDEIDGPAYCNPANGAADCLGKRCAAYDDQTGLFRFPGIASTIIPCETDGMGGNNCAPLSDLTMDETMVCVAFGSTCVPWVNADFATKTAELWIPHTEQWVELAEQQHERMYHSVAILLPDARVLTAGNGYRTGLTNHRNAEIFSPPYLFWGPRPVITSHPSSAIGYDDAFEVDVEYTPPASADETGTPASSDSIARATLVRLGSVTHQFDMDQRLVELDITNRSGDTVTLLSPLNANIAPPGWYMLFLLADSGVPSEAAYVRLQ